MRTSLFMAAVCWLSIYWECWKHYFRSQRRYVMLWSLNLKCNVRTINFILSVSKWYSSIQVKRSISWFLALFVFISWNVKCLKRKGFLAAWETPEISEWNLLRVFHDCSNHNVDVNMLNIAKDVSHNIDCKNTVVWHAVLAQKRFAVTQYLLTGDE